MKGIKSISTELFQSAFKHISFFVFPYFKDNQLKKSMSNISFVHVKYVL